MLLHRRCSSSGTVSTTLSLVGWVIVPSSVLLSKFLYLFFSFLWETTPADEGSMLFILKMQNRRTVINKDRNNGQNSTVLAVWQARVAMTLHKIAPRIMISTLSLPLVLIASPPFKSVWLCKFWVERWNVWYRFLSQLRFSNHKFRGGAEAPQSPCNKWPSFCPVFPGILGVLGQTGTPVPAVPVPVRWFPHAGGPPPQRALGRPRCVRLWSHTPQLLLLRLQRSGLSFRFPLVLLLE